MNSVIAMPKNSPDEGAKEEDEMITVMELRDEVGK